MSNRGEVSMSGELFGLADLLVAESDGLILSVVPALFILFKSVILTKSPFTLDLSGSEADFLEVGVGVGGIILGVGGTSP